MRPYADTNFLSQYYLNTGEAATIERLFLEAEDEQSDALPITWLHRVETLNAFELYVFIGKQNRQRRVTPEQAAIARATFFEDLDEGRIVVRTWIEPAELEREFEDLALRHTTKHGFRTYDLLHVASANVLGCDTFWSFDLKASKLAKLAGLKTPLQ